MVVTPEPQRPPRKVFGIGFHKTGTSSLGHALEFLGYRVAGPFGVHAPDIAATALERAHSMVPDFDAFQDNPWPLLFRELDERYPGSRFVLTQRETGAWLNSAVAHFGRHCTPMREWIYGVGCPAGNEQLYARVFDAHNAAVREHFAERPGDLLELDVTRGQGWPELCAFLGVEQPEIPFFHSNPKRRWRWLKSWLE